MSQSLSFPLTANGHSFDLSPQRLGRLQPTQPDLPVERLQAIYRDQGYLWLKGLLPRQDVLDFRRRFFALMAETGLVAPGSNPVDGIYAGGGEDKEAIRQHTKAIAMSTAYESFCLMAPLVRFTEAFLGGLTFLHKRKIIRFSRPGEEWSTPAHYDLTYLRAGTDRLITVWIPVGDTPVEMGGLIYLEGSDGWGRQKEAEFAVLNADLPHEERINAYNKNMAEGGWLTKNLPSLAERLDTRWLLADYEAGDVVVHSPYMIHGATANVSSQGTMRLSTDIRYQLVQDEIDPRWQEHWYPGDGL